MIVCLVEMGGILYTEYIKSVSMAINRVYKNSFLLRGCHCLELNKTRTKRQGWMMYI